MKNEHSDSDKIAETVEKAGSVLDTTKTALNTVKWLAIAGILALLAYVGNKVYRIISAPAKVVGQTAEGVTDAVKSGGQKVKEGASGLYNRYQISITQPDQLNALAERSFATLSDMPVSDTLSMKQKLFYKTNFAGSDNKVCSLSVDFGNGPLSVYVANDHEHYATAKALGSTDDRLMRLLIEAGDDRLGFALEWNEDSKTWDLRWRKRTVSKPISDSLAESRIITALKQIPAQCQNTP